MFADDTMIIGKIRPTHPIEDQYVMQENIIRITDWCKERQMYLNIEKCKNVRVGKRAPKIQYTITDPTTMASTRMNETEMERDLGIIISHDLKPRYKKQHQRLYCPS